MVMRIRYQSLSIAVSTLSSNVMRCQVRHKQTFVAVSGCINGVVSVDKDEDAESIPDLGRVE